MNGSCRSSASTALHAGRLSVLSRRGVTISGNNSATVGSLPGVLIGGMVVQQIALDHPELVRTLEGSYLFQNVLIGIFRLKKCEAMGIVCPTLRTYSGDPQWKPLGLPSFSCCPSRRHAHFRKNSRVTTAPAKSHSLAAVARFTRNTTKP